jgi:tetratricopeptide (TPR) repeat protein
MADLSADVKIAFEEGRYLQIVQAAEECSSPEDRLMLGISLFKLGRANEALDVLGNVAAQAEHLTKALYYLALIYRQRGDEGIAKACIQKYLAFFPDDDEAHDLIESSDSLSPQSLMKEPSAQLARIYAQQGHFEQALDIYIQVEKMNALDDDSLKEAHQTQDMYILKTLQGWLERVKR